MMMTIHFEEFRIHFAAAPVLLPLLVYVPHCPPSTVHWPLSTAATWPKSGWQQAKAQLSHTPRDPFERGEINIHDSCHWHASGYQWVLSFEFEAADWGGGFPLRYARYYQIHICTGTTARQLYELSTILFSVDKAKLRLKLKLNSAPPQQSSGSTCFVWSSSRWQNFLSHFPFSSFLISSSSASPFQSQGKNTLLAAWPGLGY